MNWIKKCVLSNVQSFIVIDELLYFFRSGEGIFIVADFNGNTVSKFEFARDFEHKVIGNSVYFNCDSTVKKIDSNLSLSTVLSTDSDYVTVVSPNKFILSNYDRQEKRYINTLIDQDKNVIDSFGTMSSFSTMNNKYIFCLIEGERYGLFELESNKFIWENKMQEKFNPAVYFIADKLFLSNKENTYCIEIESGKNSYKIEKITSKFLYSDHYPDLIHTINHKKYIALNLRTGSKILEKDLPFKVDISPHLINIFESKLYFPFSNGEGKISIGVYDLQTNNLDSPITVNEDDNSSFRYQLYMPKITSDHLFVRDNNKLLHIYEKSTNQLA